MALVRPSGVTAGFFGGIAGATPLYVASDPADALSWVGARLGEPTTEERTR